MYRRLPDIQVLAVGGNDHSLPALAIPASVLQGSESCSKLGAIAGLRILLSHGAFLLETDGFTAFCISVSMYIMLAGACQQVVQGASRLTALA